VNSDTMRTIRVAKPLGGNRLQLVWSDGTVAYYSGGDRPVPKTVLLACKGWDATHRRKAA
jgi:hypothetical protein